MIAVRVCQGDWFALGPVPGPGADAADQRPGLDRQVARVMAWAVAEGFVAGWVVTGAGSALNGKRRMFLALLRDQPVGVIVVEHRDRFARFDAGDVEAALAVSGRQLLVADPAEVDDGLVRDVTEILTSVCGGRVAAAQGSPGRQGGDHR